MSQPRSQYSSIELRASPGAENIEFRSRIPLPKSRTLSLQSMTNRGSTKRLSPGASGDSVPSRKDILKARTQSELNLPREPMSNGYAKSRSPKLGTMQLQPWKESPLSKPSSVQGTIQYKTSPTKNRSTTMTPEWKKRLVKGQASDVGQTDLFSPKTNALASVFKPMKVVTRSPKEDAGNGRVVKNESMLMRSSRPPTPSNAQHSGNVTNPSESWTKLEGTKAAGSDQDLSDDLTPIYISKEKTADGQVNYGAIDASMQRLQSNMARYRNRQEKTSSPRNVSLTTSNSNEASSAIAMPITRHDIAAQSLLDDLSVGTDTLVTNGGFVSFRRGGYSDDYPFDQRTLSHPSSPQVLDGLSLQADNLHADSSMTTQVQERALEQSLPSPKTPKRQQQSQSSPDCPRSSGSPLKLFDKHDTFTNDRLIRRMSKFEEAFQEASQKEDNLDHHQRRSTSSSNPQVSQKRAISGKDSSRNVSGVSSFGEGELDKYIFPDLSDQEPHLPRLAPEKMDEDFETRRQPAKRKPIPLCNSSNRTSAKDNFRRKSDIEFERNNTAVHQSHSKVHYTIHGKRLPYSPAKNPAPKRRRTVNSSEERRRTESVVSVDISETEIHETPSRPLVGRKRKDALYKKEQQAADPRVLAMRQIRRPRNPTPNQTTSAVNYSPEGDSRGLCTTNPVNLSSEADITIDPPTKIVAGALATIALNAAQDVTQGTRKPSVTTADFINEAQQIMRLIRAEKRPQSSHTTVGTSQIESQIISEEPVITESTRDDFSRPPSRENRSLLKLKEPARLDSRVISHLRRFEDKDELGLALSSSSKSLKISRSRTPSNTSSVVHRTDLQERDQIESDPPNVRIIEKSVQAQPGDNLTNSRSEHAMGKQRMNSDASNHFTKSSIPTGSSGSSSRKFVIAPETVAHLLSDQMAGMIFDRGRQVWIKRKGSINANAVDASEVRSEDSEEDLLGDIPDLTVNEMEELQMVKDAVFNDNAMLSFGDKIDHEHCVPSTLSAATGEDANNGIESRPVTADGKSTVPIDNSSAPSKYSHFGSSGPAPSTRATSWGDNYWPQNPQPMQIPSLDAVDEQASPDDAEEVEHEISILEGRIAKAPNREGDYHHKTRVVTVAFSSPLVEHVQSPNLPEFSARVSHEEANETPIRRFSQRKVSMGRYMPSSNRKKSHQTSLKLSKDDQSYHKRPMSRLDEHEEMSIIPYSVNGNRTLQLAISTPLPLSKSIRLTPSTSRFSSKEFTLSPLADFTVHQVDRPVDAAAFKRGDERALIEANNKLSYTAQDLIKHLTDLEPYEPYWEYLRTLNLRDRGLTSLHMLDEFCIHTEELDVSGNRIGELNGVPSSVRLLNISSNALSDLSAWHHLQHLQYLDVSSNGLTSFKGLHMLMHLRTLKADDNAIDSLEGIEDLDGLLNLRMRRNQLRSVDFKSFDLYDVF